MVYQFLTPVRARRRSPLHAHACKDVFRRLLRRVDGVWLTNKMKSSPGSRRGLPADYAHFLDRTHRRAEAVELLRAEIESAPTSASAKQAAHLLALDFEHRVRPDDELLWKWLEGQPRWEVIAERLLWRMLEHVPHEQRERHFVRAEHLTNQAHPSRTYTLGWIMNRMGFAGRSITLLERAMDAAQEIELKEQAAFTLFESSTPATGSALRSSSRKRAVG